MIIWINGTYGVGKTTTIDKLKEKLESHNCSIISSDEFHKKNPHIFDSGGGCYPQNNKKFNKYFKEHIIEIIKHNTKKYIIIDMALTDKICKEQLFDYFVNKEKNLIHIILTASKETIKSRIRNDKNRDYTDIISYLDYNLHFLEQNYDNAIRINTESENINDIVDEIIRYIDKKDKIK